MRIGILQADSVLERFQPRHGDYPRMLMDLFNQAAEGATLRFDIIDILHGGPYPSPTRCDAYVITGSRHSVYEDLPWLSSLVAFVRQALAAGRRVVGICFGHQLLAHFFGGCAERAQGWAVGVHGSRILCREAWMAPPADAVNLLSSHQDQVTRLPDGAKLIASNDFCPIAGFTWGGQVLTFQGHPEFAKAYSRDLMNMRRELLGPETHRAGLASLAQETQQRLVGRWILNFCGAPPAGTKPAAAAA